MSKADVNEKFSSSKPSRPRPLNPEDNNINIDFGYESLHCVISRYTYVLTWLEVEVLTWVLHTDLKE